MKLVQVAKPLVVISIAIGMLFLASYFHLKPIRHLPETPSCEGQTK